MQFFWSHLEYEIWYAARRQGGGRMFTIEVHNAWEYAKSCHFVLFYCMFLFPYDEAQFTFIMSLFQAKLCEDTNLLQNFKYPQHAQRSEKTTTKNVVMKMQGSLFCKNILLRIQF